MTTPQLSAYQAAESFLDESRNVSGKDHSQVLIDTVRRARAVIMQCATALAPVEERPGQPQESPLTVGDLNLARSTIFETLTTSPQWWQGMIFAINTAKKMGCTNFEITIAETQDKQQRRPRHPMEEYYNMLTEGEDWRASVVNCFKITVYAVTVK